MRTQLSRVALAVVCVAALTSALAGFAQATPPAASQYVEQIPTAAGAKPAVATASTGHPATAQGSAGTATTTTTTPTTTSTNQSAHGSPSPTGRPPSRQRAVDPIRAAVAAGNGNSGLGRGALFAIVLAAITLAALAGLLLRRRLER